MLIAQFCGKYKRNIQYKFAFKDLQLMGERLHIQTCTHARIQTRTCTHWYIVYIFLIKTLGLMMIYIIISIQRR
jgi:hypothetical protein